MRLMRAGLLIAIGCGACLVGSGCGDRDAVPTLQTESRASPRWVHRYVPKDLERYRPEEDRWRPESEVPRGRVTDPGMVIWEVSEYPPGSTPTPDQARVANDMVERCYAAARRHGWYQYERGLAAGYHLVDSLHYRNDEYMLDDHIIDPDRPEALLYIATPPDGKQHLAGVMFYTKGREARGPQFGGPLTIWHWHTWFRPQCVVGGVGGKWSVGGKCERGVPSQYSGEMMHVWLVDHPAGPFGSPMHIPHREFIAGLERRLEERGF